MSRRRALIGSAGSPSGRIPAEYQEVEWIGTNGQQNTNTATIDTGFVPKTNPRAVFDVASADGNLYPFGFNDVVASPTWIIYGGLKYYKWGTTSNTTGLGTNTPWHWYHFDAGSKLIVDNVQKADKGTADWSANSKSVRIMSTAGNSNCKFKEIFLYDGNSLKMDLVPCYRKSDNRIGFFDLIGNQFLTNMGAASALTKGADVT